MKKFIATTLSLIILLHLITGMAKDYPQKFYDVPKDHWAFEFIAELVDMGAINGYEDSSYKPDNTVARAEWAKIMVVAANRSLGGSTPSFNDMVGHWANEYVNAAKDYMTSYEGGTAFRPDIAALREDVTVALVKLKGYSTDNADFSYISNFTDQDSISANCKKYVAVAVEKGLINGNPDGTYRGQGTLTRAEAATLLWRAFQVGNDDKVVDRAGDSVGSANNPSSSSTPAPVSEPFDIYGVWSTTDARLEIKKDDTIKFSWQTTSQDGKLKKVDMYNYQFTDFFLSRDGFAESVNDIYDLQYNPNNEMLRLELAPSFIFYFIKVDVASVNNETNTTSTQQSTPAPTKAPAPKKGTLHFNVTTPTVNGAFEYTVSVYAFINNTKFVITNDEFISIDGANANGEGLTQGETMEYDIPVQVGDIVRFGYRAWGNLDIPTVEKTVEVTEQILTSGEIFELPYSVKLHTFSVTIPETSEKRLDFRAELNGILLLKDTYYTVPGFSSPAKQAGETIDFTIIAKAGDRLKLTMTGEEDISYIITENNLK